MINPYTSSPFSPLTAHFSPSRHWLCSFLSLPPFSFSSFSLSLLCVRSLSHTHTPPSQGPAPSLLKGSRASEFDKDSSVSSDLTTQSHDQFLLTHSLMGSSLLQPTSGLPPARQPQPEPQCPKLLEASHTERAPSNDQAKKPSPWVCTGELLKGHTCPRHYPVQPVYFCPILSFCSILGPMTLLNFLRVSISLFGILSHYTSVWLFSFPISPEGYQPLNPHTQCPLSFYITLWTPLP